LTACRKCEPLCRKKTVVLKTTSDTIGCQRETRSTRKEPNNKGNPNLLRSAPLKGTGLSQMQTSMSQKSRCYQQCASVASKVVGAAPLLCRVSISATWRARAMKTRASGRRLPQPGCAALGKILRQETILSQDGGMMERSCRSRSLVVARFVIGFDARAVQKLMNLSLCCLILLLALGQPS